MDDFYLFANCNFVPDQYAAWQAAYDDLATYVYANEHTTKTYYFGIPIDYAHDFNATTSMLAFEVYGRREDLYTTHLSSPAMATFLKRIEPTTTTNLDLAHYRLIAGFLDNNGDAPPAGILQDTRLTCVSPSARCSVLASLTDLLNNVHEEEKHNGGKNGVLTYMAFECLDDDVGVRILGRWRDRKDMEIFVRRGDVDRFWQGQKPQISRMEQRCYVPNGKGWLHRG
ncbi:hypothetical protein DPSP01_006512 [Paraphaeosphaeria sporulosa]|uniref:ABM domain-containing protein n=1 Tax=Paraphaeosphaeria sporulosa TaxID=1460663 RepID=A0A177CNV3_9PLEO|nr:uncharacterized protein CC84DRAFT_1257435 [Paraphaeosphaeria sporulosa]OAG08598.1 hypothetical protein CC84DRAFT_1257435 [Paraphaeosphaeria sporulosa]